MENIRHSVLIVDDQESGIKQLVKILGPEYIIYTARGGEEAIKAAKEYFPDVILLDILMLDMDGFEVISQLKASEITKEIPIIFITSLMSSEQEKRGLSLGAADYITKPYSPDIVKLRLKNQINMLEQFRTIEQQMSNIQLLEYENVKNMLDSTPYSCHLWNKNFEMLDCNEATLSLFKIAAKKEFIDNFPQFSPEYQPDETLSHKKAMDHLEAAFVNGKSVFEYTHCTSDGTPIPCEMTLVRIKLQSDYFVVAYLKDLREYKAMTAEIHQQDQLLRTANNVAGILLQSVESFEEFTNNMYKCMGMMAEAVDTDRVYIWKNHIEDDELYCTQIYEWSGSAEPQQDKDITVSVSYRDNIPEWEETLAKGKCINSRVRDMLPASQAQLAPQGILSIFITPIFVRDEFWGFIGFDDCHDERVFNESEESVLSSAGLLIANAMIRNEMNMELTSSSMMLEEALEEAKAANVAKSNFLSNMSHEIRTPMNAIIGMAELLVHESLNDRQAGYVTDIVVSAKSLLTIINDILDFSKIESGKMELNPVDYDFRAFVDHIKSMFVYVAQKKGLEFKLECDDSLPDYLYGDDIRLRQTLTNILGNAVKFTAKGYVRLKINKIDDSLFFEVKDTGIGIRKENMLSLFTAFEQVDKSKNRNIVGTGLGLAISKSFVEMMGGSIMLESEYEQGTVFTIKIPAVTGNKEQVENKKSSNENCKISAPEAKILVVDDNEFNLKVAQGLLGLFKIHAELVDSGKEAIEKVRNDEYDIVFMDHMMPEMDGVEATRQIRELSEKQKILPIIALTANAIAGAREMFLANGFNDFISKPIDSQELIRILLNWLPAGKVIEEAAETKEGGAGGESEFLTALAKVEEVNPEIGLSRVSGIEEMYRETLILFNKKLPSECKKMSEFLNAKDALGFAITIHAMKSALSTIGAMRLSETALNLEAASKNKEIDYCVERYGDLEKNLTILHEQLSQVLPDSDSNVEKTKGDESLLSENVEKAIAAAEEFDSDLGVEIINNLIKYDFGKERNALLEDALMALKDFNCGEAAESLREVISYKGVS
ncbi:MAG: response regulator [Chitinispirillia bacterium]|nr:response regulator [Chitinispirillia bacterium]